MDLGAPHFQGTPPSKKKQLLVSHNFQMFSDTPMCKLMLPPWALNSTKPPFSPVPAGEFRSPGDWLSTFERRYFFLQRPHVPYDAIQEADLSWIYLVCSRHSSTNFTSKHPFTNLVTHRFCQIPLGRFNWANMTHRSRTRSSFFQFGDVPAIFDNT